VISYDAAMRAKDMPRGTLIRVGSARLLLRLEYGRKPWRATGSRGRFSHAEVDGSIQAGDVEILELGTDSMSDVAAV
jgi:hypothetical protein